MSLKKVESHPVGLSLTRQADAVLRTHREVASGTVTTQSNDIEVLPESFNLGVFEPDSTRPTDAVNAPNDR